ncbi:MAG: mechanosensitive ion channel domain-containing protein [Promethearchaeota archaeon]
MAAFQMELFLTLEFKIILFVVAIIVVFLIQWILQLIMAYKVKKIEYIPQDVINGLKILIRLSAITVCFYIFLVLFDVSLESAFGLSAILGAIISFGSVQWISNFLAGIYLLMTHPFGVGDFISIRPDIKGEVVEISLNYTKIRTINDSFHHIPNRIFLRSNIMNYEHEIKRRLGSKEIRALGLKEIARLFKEEKVIRYSFNWGAPLGDLEKTKYALQEICDIYTGIFGYKPEFFLYSLDYRMQFKIIVTTHNAKILIQNIRDFRNEIVSRFH